MCVEDEKMIQIFSFGHFRESEESDSDWEPEVQRPRKSPRSPVNTGRVAEEDEEELQGTSAQFYSP